MWRRRELLAGIAAVAASIVISTAPALAQKRGGDVVMAQQAQPPTLDGMTTTAQASRNISLHIYEQLFARDEKGSPIPDLAQKVDISADGKTYVFTLRQGVKFHNGKEMTSADVKASLERYAKVGGRPTMMNTVDGIEATDKYVVTIKLKDVTPGFVDQLSSPGAPAVIIPAEEAAKEANKINYIGTGPFEFVEYRPDSHVKLKRFEGYVANPNYQGRDGFGGKKTAYFDTITIRFMPEGGARTSALQTGEVHILEALATPAAKRLKDDKGVKAYEMIPWAFQTFMLNENVAPTNNIKVREAIFTALDPEEIMAISTDGLYRLTHGWQHPGTDYYAGDIGKSVHGLKNKAKAQALLKEAGYKGEPFVIITDNSFKNHNDTAVVAAQQLEAIGMKVEVKVMDWPTVSTARRKPDGWNAWPLMMGIEPYEGPYGVVSFFISPTPTQIVVDPVIDEINKRLNTSLNIEDRKKAFADFQTRMFEQFHAIKVGDVGIYQATRSNVANYKPYRIPRMWDVWFE